jgi:hypothetical protein
MLSGQCLETGREDFKSPKTARQQIVWTPMWASCVEAYLLPLGYWQHQISAQTRCKMAIAIPSPTIGTWIGYPIQVPIAPTKTAISHRHMP